MAKPATVVLRLDRSKKYSTIHGDRVGDDPHASVAFMQDGLPYDSEGILVPDDGKNAPWEILHDNVRIKHHPLYTQEMRDKVKRKLDRATKGIPKDDVDEHDEESVKADASEDVNLESWLRGEIRYPAFMIYAACKKRFSKSFTKLSDVIDDLVLDEKIIPEQQVDPALLRQMGARPL